MDIRKLRKLLPDRVIWTTHCLERMSERDIKRADVKSCISNGEIIEEYPDDYPKPSCLIMGTTDDGKYLHVVVGYEDTQLFIITAYYPTIDVFENDLKTRRK